MAGMKSIQVIAIALVIIGIVIGVGFIVLETFEETLGTNTATVNNETIVPSGTGNYVAFNHTTTGVYCYNSFSPVITNQTGGTVILSGNYTYQPATGFIQNISTWGGMTGWNVTYTYNYNNGSACSGLNDTNTAIATIPGWLTILVLILVVGIILYIVFKAIPKGSGGDGTIAQI